MLAIEPRTTPSPATIYMLFARDLKPQLDPNNTNAHYNAIVTTQSNNSPDFDEGYFDETQVSQELSKYNASHSGETFYLTDELFDFVITKRVPQLPYNIDGIARFEISCEERFWKKRVKDGHYWNTNWSGRQELNGLRRLCKCHGSLKCTNDKCPTFQIHQTANRRSFTLIGGTSYKCKICGQLAEREWCGAKRAIEYNRDTKILTVWHEGKHNCVLKCSSVSKEQKEAKKDLLKTVLRIFPRLPKTKLIDVGVQYYIQRGYPDVAQEFVQACTDKDIVNEAKEESYAELLGMDQNSVHAVSIIKNKIDTVDPYYIYKINDRRWNGSGTYVFKSSQTAAEIGLAMDRTARETPFKDLIAHMDGLHSRVKGFITLTLWVKNPVSLITHRLCCMECESEDTENVTRFLNLFNEILHKVKKDPTFVWAPRGIMTDENGANKNAVNAVFGESMANRTWSCTWHYLRCVR